MGVEHHRQRFATTLGVPEDTTLAIKLGGNLCLVNRLANHKILMVTCQNFDGLLTVSRNQFEITAKDVGKWITYTYTVTISENMLPALVNGSTTELPLPSAAELPFFLPIYCQLIVPAAYSSLTRV